jgi:7,8-dihydropterin-6-yl-methyl-4-(beta-D-ribofuranosyl)aminobenzene 5'-phosphate synthase
VIITGEIPRVTKFEKGFPLQYKEEKDELDLVPDPLVNDDQALIMNIKDKGLIILTGCGHAGIINTIKYAKKATGKYILLSVDFTYQDRDMKN